MKGHRVSVNGEYSATTERKTEFCTFQTPDSLLAGTLYARGFRDVIKWMERRRIADVVGESITSFDLTSMTLLAVL